MRNEEVICDVVIFKPEWSCGCAHSGDVIHSHDGVLEMVGTWRELTARLLDGYIAKRRCRR